MTIEEFAAAWKTGGVSVVFDQTALEFANAWATVVLGNYMMDSGSNLFNMGKGMLQTTEDQISASPKGKIVQ